MKLNQGILVVLICSFSNLCLAQSVPNSSIQAGVFIDLNDFQSVLNNQLPEVLERIDQKGKKCVEAQWLKTKGIPKCSFKGIKLYCKDSWIKTKTTPDISCDVSGVVKRTGPIKLEGRGNALIVQLPLHASVTARGRGDIGKNIQQSANAAAEITFRVSNIRIGEDWKLNGDTSASYNWTKRPTLKLFNLIDVNVSNSVSPEVDRQLRAFSEQLESELSKIDLKPTIERYWADLQRPRSVDGLHSRFVPAKIVYTGLQFNQRKLETVLQLDGEIESQSTPFADTTQLALLPIEHSDIASTNSRLNAEVSINYSLLNSRIKNVLTTNNWMDVELAERKLGRYKFENVELSGRDERLLVNADLVFDDGESFFSSLSFWSLFSKKVRVEISGVPFINSTKNTISLNDITFEQLYLDSESKSVTQEKSTFENSDIFNDIITSLGFMTHIEESLVYDFTNELKQVTNGLTFTNSSGENQTINFDAVSLGKLKVSDDKILIPVSAIVRDRIQFEVNASG